MATTWILVAHRGGARIFENRSGERELKLVENIDHAVGRLQAHELESDRSGRSFDRMGDQRHGISSGSCTAWRGRRG